MSVQDALLFKTKLAWAEWLEQNHRESPGVWLRFAKKGSDVQSVTYAEALEVALCYGWIDSQKKAFDAATFLQKFQPRAARSLWSKINRTKATELITTGAMRPAGLDAVEKAKQNGQWEQAYDSPAGAVVPPDFAAALQHHPQAGAFFETLNKANRYAVLWRIQTAKKPETRARKIEQMIAMLERGEKLH